MKIVSVVGARPQFVKAAVVSRALQQRPEVQEVLLHTGQHYDKNMSQVFFEELEIPQPEYNLGIGGGTHGQNTGRMIEAIEAVLLQERPDWVLVYGDTDSTLAGALAAVKLHIPIAHVEAGLRSFNRRMPEEINRVLTDHAADLLFAPTQTAVANLQREGIPAKRIAMVGDVMYDAALYYATKAEQRSRILSALGLAPRGYILATVHRAENTDDPERLRTIVASLERVTRELPVVLPLHPRTRKALKTHNLWKDVQGVRLIDPVGYLDMVMLEKYARLIVTDSGGVQKEAFFHKVPCVTLRTETEWVELVESGWNIVIAPTDEHLLCQTILSRLNAKGSNTALYGDGYAVEKILQRLHESYAINAVIGGKWVK